MTKKPIGIIEGKLHPCLNVPNCVSTQSYEERSKMDPIKYFGSLEEAKFKILRIINSLKRTKIKIESKNYIHVEFRTALFRFVDDVEFYFDDAEKIIHFRSTSRLGSNDWGVNRKRMENITKLFYNKN
ncbi:MAG: DUF1499 domain-containing protein [Promethearchaeota archaeon]